MIINHVYTVLLRNISITCWLWISCAADLPAQISNIQHVVDTTMFKSHLFFLGGDSLQGRGTGTSGEVKAALYIANRLTEYGLKQLGDRNSYLQLIPMHGSRPLESSYLQISTDTSTQILELNKDYLLYKTGAQTFIPTPVSLVFVGYGINAPEFDYNDYAVIDAREKIMVMLSGEPSSDDSSYFEGVQPTIYSTPEAKQRIALAHGAKGSIIIPNPRLEQSRTWNDWVRDFSFEDVSLIYSTSWHLSILLNPASAELLFKNSPIPLREIFRLERQGKMHSFELRSKLNFSGYFRERDFFGRNVIGMLEGKDYFKSDSYILLSAHFDHLGIGPAVRQDSIYNGVFDNAAGVSALLELARILSLERARLKRSLIFLFVTGEEKGLLGSAYYVDHPARPLYHTLANINIDGLSLFDEFNSVCAPGINYSTLQESLLRVLEQNMLKLTGFPAENFLEFDSIIRSDQYSFAKAGIPFAVILEGLDYKNTDLEQGKERFINWIRTVYHTPFDDLNQPINYAAARQHIQLLADYILYLCSTDDEIKWKPNSPFISARLRSIAEKR